MLGGPPFKSTSILVSCQMTAAPGWTPHVSRILNGAPARAQVKRFIRCWLHIAQNQAPIDNLRKLVHRYIEVRDEECR